MDPVSASRDDRAVEEDNVRVAHLRDPTSVV